MADAEAIFEAARHRRPSGPGGRDFAASVAIWGMNDKTIASAAVVANPGTSWHAVGAGEFNGDGNSDILLQNTDGSVAIWGMNDKTITSAAVVADPGASWHAVAAGDFNGDGMSDILLQNTDGAIAIWGMNDKSEAVVAPERRGRRSEPATTTGTV